jgi:hypothetical protein
VHIPSTFRAILTALLLTQATTDVGPDALNWLINCALWSTSTVHGCC